MAQKTFLVLVGAIVVVQGLLLAHLSRDARPPLLVVVAPPEFRLPTALRSAAARAGVAGDADWHDTPALLCALLEKYGLVAGSGSADAVQARLQAEGTAGGARLASLQARAATLGGDITRAQARAIAREAELVTIADQLRPTVGDGPTPPSPTDDAWQRLQARLEGAP